MGREIAVSPPEYRVVKPVVELAEYIKRKVGGRLGEVSDHEITKIFPFLEDLAAGKELETTAIARIMAQLERSFGFESDEERAEVEKTVVDLVETVWAHRRRDPVGVFKLLRGLRQLLIGLVRGWITMPILAREGKQSEKAEEVGG